jgi:hypothetical protein
MKLNINPDWLLKMSEKEDNKNVSVGGFITRIKRLEDLKQK